MLQFYVNQKFLTFVKEDFTILDGAGAPVYKVEGQALWSGKRLKIKDLEDNVQFVLNRRLMRFFTTIDINDAEKNRLARFKERFHIGFKQRCRIQSEQGDVYELEGNFWSTNYQIYKVLGTKQEPNNVVVGTVQRDFIQFGDKYRVDVLQEQEAMMILAIVLCVDMFRVQKQKRSSNNNSIFRT